MLLTGCPGPSREFWTQLKCRPDVSGGALENKPGSTPLSMQMGILHAGLSSCLGLAGSTLGTLCVGDRKSRGKKESSQRALSEKWAALPNHSPPLSKVRVDEPATLLLAP